VWLEANAGKKKAVRSRGRREEIGSREVALVSEGCVFGMGRERRKRRENATTWSALGGEIEKKEKKTTTTYYCITIYREGRGSPTTFSSEGGKGEERRKRQHNHSHSVIERGKLLKKRASPRRENSLNTGSRSGRKKRKGRLVFSIQKAHRLRARKKKKEIDKSGSILCFPEGRCRRGERKGGRTIGRPLPPYGRTPSTSWKGGRERSTGGKGRGKEVIFFILPHKKGRYSFSPREGKSVRCVFREKGGEKKGGKERKRVLLSRLGNIRKKISNAHTMGGIYSASLNREKRKKEEMNLY